MKEIPLKECCPFCQSTGNGHAGGGTLIVAPTHGDTGFHVVCMACTMNGPFATTRADARLRWNRRTRKEWWSGAVGHGLEDQSNPYSPVFIRNNRPRSSKTNKQLIAEVKTIVKKISAQADKMGDCGGMQGSAVMAQHPGWTNRITFIEEELKRRGLTEEQVSKMCKPTLHNLSVQIQQIKDHPKTARMDVPKKWRNRQKTKE